jgi:molybdenum cofactor biosynthesis enzyme MoaA
MAAPTQSLDVSTGQPLPLVSQPPREAVLAEIRKRLEERGETLADAIAARDLYFRVSLVGACNLSCTFCHNEGAPKEGKIKLEDVDVAIDAAVKAGFTRVQFTGGEPLLRPDVAEFVRLARTYVDDVGVTTNGVYLPRRIDGLLEAGIARMHVSLQTESLIAAGDEQRWGIPPWLVPTVDLASSGAFRLRVNLPVPADTMAQAETFLHDVTEVGVDVKVFAVLPEGQVKEEEYPLDRLEGMVERINAARAGAERGSVLLRGYRPPEGVRCPTCSDRPRCMEQSHSLRLGADLTLRPCLATRQWDSSFAGASVEQNVREAALLALDYRWC